MLNNALFQKYCEFIDLHEKIGINPRKSYLKDKSCFIFDRSIAGDIKVKLKENFALSRFVSFQIPVLTKAYLKRNLCIYDLLRAVSSTQNFRELKIQTKLLRNYFLM